MSAAVLVAGTVSACSYPEWNPRNFGITNVKETKDQYKYDHFTGRIGTCDVSGFFMQDKELWAVTVTDADDNQVVQGVKLTNAKILTDDPAVKQSCGV